MKRPSLAPAVVVTVAAFVTAWVLVRTSQSVLLDRIDAGDPTPIGEPPARPLGARGEATAPARCVALGTPVSLAASGPGELAFGDGVLDARGVVAVGVVRGVGSERKASILSFGLDRPSVEIVDVGPARGDDPPPRPVFVGDKVYAARIETSRGARALTFASVAATSASDAGAIPQSADESLAFDVVADDGRVFAAWDDDDAGRGVIRLVGAPAGTVLEGRAPVVVVSPKTSDAEAPRLVADGAGGVFVAWIARKPEGDAGGASEAKAHALESPAEEREARAVEIVHVDASGAVSTAQRLVPARVSDFDLERSGNEVVVVMRDEDGAEARGARLVRQSVRVEGAGLTASPPIVVMGAGVGAADPILLDDGQAGLAMVTDMAERPRLVVVPSTPSTDAGAPSVEPAIDTGRVLASRSASALPPAGPRIRAAGRLEGRGAVVISAGFPGGRPEARILLCER